MLSDFENSAKKAKKFLENEYVNRASVAKCSVIIIIHHLACSGLSENSRLVELFFVLSN